MYNKNPQSSKKNTCHIKIVELRPVSHLNRRNIEESVRRVTCTVLYHGNSQRYDLCRRQREIKFVCCSLLPNQGLSQNMKRTISGIIMDILCLLSLSAQWLGWTDNFRNNLCRIYVLSMVATSFFKISLVNNLRVISFKMTPSTSAKV